MRLINVNTNELEEHAKPPPYVILSHRWEEDEVTLERYRNATLRDSNGFVKITSLLSLVRNTEQHANMINHAWVDTCCIDKTSSAELSEAINSMYRWYKNSQNCIAYLSDVDTAEDMEKSAWFTRGWTLQELIAPVNVTFYNKDWDLLGTKLELCADLSRITGIDSGVLSNDKDVMACSIAQRFSWASNRDTTRVEDRAYSLMGLFDVNMPMLYGEAEKAFYRLQQEIIRESDDQSIFAWTLQPSFTSQLSVTNFEKVPQRAFSLIARSVDDFKDCRDVEICSPLIRQLPYFLTNVGLSISLFLLPWTMHVYIGILNCERVTTTPGRRCCIFLRRIAQEDQFARVTVGGCDSVLLLDQVWELLLRQVPQVPRGGLTVRVRQRLKPDWLREWHYGFQLIPPVTTLHGDVPTSRITIHRRMQNANANPNLLLLPDGQSGTVATIVFRNMLLFNKVVYVRLGFDFNFVPVVLATLETVLELDPAGFLRPADGQFRAENGCKLHNWLKEIVENDGKHFTNSSSTLAMIYLNRPDYQQQQSDDVRIHVHKVEEAQGPHYWTVSIELNLDSLRNKAGERPESMSSKILYQISKSGTEQRLRLETFHKPAL